ncbi:MAG: nucleoside hydrolase [Pseudomonadota bacterium]
MTREKIIIDTDPGVDDAMAILYAFCQSEIDLVGLTTIFGNVTTDVATRNALALVEMCGKEIPVARGADKPIGGPSKEVAWEVHGHDGFGDVPAMSPKSGPVDMPAHEFLCEMVNRFPGEITLCPVGPLTNLALALEHDPAIVSKVKGVTVMGGSLDEGGNVTPHAEANIWQDPEAADKVFAASWPVTMIGLDVTHRVVCTPADFATLAEKSPKLGGFLNDAAQFYFEFHRRVDGLEGCHMHDPTAVISIIRPQWFSIDPTPLGVILDGEKVGTTIRHSGNSRPAVNVALGIQSEEVKSHFLASIRD